MVLMTSKKTGRPHTIEEKVRQDMLDLWLKGYNYSEIARKFNTYRQKSRTVILSFSPALEDFKKHDENRRIRAAAAKLHSSTV